MKRKSVSSISKKYSYRRAILFVLFVGSLLYCVLFVFALFFLVGAFFATTKTFSSPLFDSCHFIFEAFYSALQGEGVTMMITYIVLFLLGVLMVWVLNRPFIKIFLTPFSNFISTLDLFQDEATNTEKLP